MTIPATMKAAVMTEPRRIATEDRPIPELAEREALVKVMAVGVCGSDVHYFEHGRIGGAIVRYPMILGHECAGEVVAVAQGVTRLKPGDRVAIEPQTTCGRCPACKSGKYNLCPEVEFFATPPIDGSFAQYVKMREDFLFPIPDRLSYEEAALIEPFSVGIHAANRTGLKPGASVAIMGMGPVGLLAVVAARAYGASRIYVTDLEPARLEAAKKLGATHAINVRERDAVETIKELNGGSGVDVAWETAGNPKALQSALLSLKRGGKLAIVGLPVQAEVPLDIHYISDHEVDIYGVFRYAGTYAEGIEILASGIADVSALITDRYPLDRTQEAMERAMNNKSESLKVIVYPNELGGGRGESMTEFSVRSLTCEYREALLGTDVRVPRFGWKLESDRRGTVQTAYRIQIAESEEGFDTPTWDSGRIDSDRSVLVEYGGPAARSRTRYFYRVKAWDNYGRETEWSRPGWWETALLSPEEWQAEWITPDPEAVDPDAKEAFLLRKKFQAKSGIRSARIYATAAGVYELYVNGVRVGEDVLAPGWTSYRERHQYQTYDAADLLREGGNAIGIALGDGWYKGELTWLSKRNVYGDRRAALLQLCVQYEDGTEEWVTTDRSWQAGTGAIRMSELYAGEIYDARMERSGWSEADGPNGEWVGTEAVPLGYDKLAAQENDPTRVTETLNPQAVLRTPQGDRVLDMGQNLVGRMRFSLDLPEGARVRLRHAEVLDKEGNFYTGNLRKAKQTVEYIAGEAGRASYAPHFTFHGFRYVLVEGLEHLSDDSLKNGFVAEVLHTDMEPTGSFECSNPLVNRLQQNIVWGQRGNFLDVPTDCPQRDERLGWTGDAQVFIRTAAFNYHVGPFFTKWLRDLKADQRDTGSVPYVVPNALEDYTSTMWGDETYTSSAWGDAATVCPWTVYQVYGDRRLLEEQYGSMKAWVEFIRAQGDDEGLWNTGFHFGDWLALDAHEGSYFGATPVELVATAYYALSTRILGDAAAVLGKDEEAAEYGRLLEGIVAKFRETFLTAEGRMAASTQTANILPLVFGLADGEDRKRIAADLNELVVRNGYHLDTGFVGTPYLCIALSENGYHETAMKLLLQDTYPSWLYSITKGATTIWEHWDGIKPDGSFWSDDMNSYNHYAYGAIGDWLYRYVAGLDMDESEPAYKRAKIRPGCLNEDLTFARASFESAYGQVASGWRSEGGDVFVDVVVPANASADVLLPEARLAGVTESGRSLYEAEGVRSFEQTDEGVWLTVGSGSYCFRFPKADEN